MQGINFGELKRRTRHYFDAVQRGEVIRVLRYGKPIADIVRIPKHNRSWKRETLHLTIPGLMLSREILKDRMVSER
jgi:antitoxin (DNA-binding transcriptional repressor) of toxin-antitoxin stability system